MFTGLGMGLGGGLVMGLFWGALIVGAVWLARSLFPNGQHLSASSTRLEASAEGILKQRYARGEITTEQFDAMRRDIVE